MPDSNPTRKPAWPLLVLLFALANFLEVAVVAHFVLFTPTFLYAIGFGSVEVNAWTGPIASMAFLVGIWFVPFWGVLADRYGRKPLILRSYYVETAALVLAALSGNVWLYLFARALSGLALGNTGLMFAALTEAAPPSRVALSLSLVNGSAPLGSLVGAMVGGIVVARYGVHWLFAVDAVVAASVLAVLSVGFRETFVRKPTPPIVAMLRAALRDVARSGVARTIFLLNFIHSSAFLFSYTYLPVRIGEIAGQANAPTAIGTTQGVAGIATLAGSVVWGSLADRIGHRRLLAVLMAGMAAAWLPVYLSQTIPNMIVAWTALSFVNPSVTSLMFAIISLNVPAEKRGSILGMIYLPMNVAFILAPFTASFVARSLEVRDVFLVSTLLSTVAFAALALGMRRMAEERPRSGPGAGRRPDVELATIGEDS